MHTSHGHYIEGTTPTPQPVQVARCGGPGLCEQCSKEAMAAKTKAVKPDISTDSQGTNMTTITPTTYTRIPFEVEAVQVTEENMEAVAEWCHGDIHEEEGQKYIKVRVHRPMNERQTRARVDDWVLYSNNGFKVFTPKAFEKTFELPRNGTEPGVVIVNDEPEMEKVLDGGGVSD